MKWNASEQTQYGKWEKKIEMEIIATSMIMAEPVELNALRTPTQTTSPKPQQHAHTIFAIGNFVKLFDENNNYNVYSHLICTQCELFHISISPHLTFRISFALRISIETFIFAPTKRLQFAAENIQYIFLHCSAEKFEWQKHKHRAVCNGAGNGVMRATGKCKCASKS